MKLLNKIYNCGASYNCAVVYYLQLSGQYFSRLQIHRHPDKSESSRKTFVLNFWKFYDMKKSSAR